MATKSTKFSHSIFIKVLMFVIAAACLTGAAKMGADLITSDGDIEIIFVEDSYYTSESYIMPAQDLVSDLSRLLDQYKSEKNILNGKTIDKDNLKYETADLYWEYTNSEHYDPELGDAKNRQIFEQKYKDKMTEKVKKRLMQNDLENFHMLLQNVKEVKGLVYYATNGENEYKNSKQTTKKQFESYPAYMLMDGYEQVTYPNPDNSSKLYHRLASAKYMSGSGKNTIFIGYPETYLNGEISQWKESKETATASFYQLLAFLAGFVVSLVYLMVISGRRSFADKQLYMNPLDKLYADISLVLCMCLGGFWIVMIGEIGFPVIAKWIILLTAPVTVLVFILFLSLVRHVKNGSIIKHTLLYQVISRVILFIKDVYDNGSIAVKTVLIVIGYPLLIAATYFIFPITIAAAAWFALKKVKAFKQIQDGACKIKNGDIHHTIEVPGDGEFARLAADINDIKDGLKHAVDSELKNERLKTELITNVSHDIRTPLTSIITYVDLLKQEKDPAKMEEYVAVLDQKSKRLKLLTDDLFAAAKASSGDIPVQLEQIDIVSLVTQGLGEVSEKIEEKNLEFRFNHPEEKVYIQADGKLLWRAIENVLSNIFKYTLESSRVYIDIVTAGDEVQLSFKNISKYELNISAGELMERFKRGDESRSSQGSGLGLSIAESLVEIQHGKFVIEIDGDLFKSTFYLRMDGTKH